MVLQSNKVIRRTINSRSLNKHLNQSRLKNRLKQLQLHPACSTKSKMMERTTTCLRYRKAKLRTNCKFSHKNRRKTLYSLLRQVISKQIQSPYKKIPKVTLPHLLLKLSHSQSRSLQIDDPNSRINRNLRKTRTKTSQQQTKKKSAEVWVQIKINVKVMCSRLLPTSQTSSITTTSTTSLLQTLQKLPRRLLSSCWSSHKTKR